MGRSDCAIKFSVHSTIFQSTTCCDPSLLHHLLRSRSRSLLGCCYKGRADIPTVPVFSPSGLHDTYTKGGYSNVCANIPFSGFIAIVRSVVNCYGLADLHATEFILYPT